MIRLSYLLTRVVKKLIEPVCLPGLVAEDGRCA